MESEPSNLINSTNQEKIATVIENQVFNTITKKIAFKRETLKNLVTMASREYFSSKLKQDEIISEMLDIIINSYYDEYLSKLSQK